MPPPTRRTGSMGARGTGRGDEEYHQGPRPPVYLAQVDDRSQEFIARHHPLLSTINLLTWLSTYKAKGEGLKARGKTGFSGFCLDMTAKAAHGQGELFNKAAYLGLLV